MDHEPIPVTEEHAEAAASYSTSPSRRRVTVRRRPVVGLVLLVLLVLLTLVVGAVGGVGGFVLLSSSRNPVVSRVRNTLGINDGGSLAVPIKETINVVESSAVIDASKKVSPAVVSITTSQEVSNFLGQVSTQQVAGGTGFIITSDGLIVTNKHVITGASSYKVVTSDGRIFDATIQATDPGDDLAILKITAKDLPVVDLGDSDTLQVGQSVIAVGNALGEYSNSVTLGVVSAKGRNISASSEGGGSTQESLTGLIQTDAAINPGNSGGPLVNLAGQVVGINTAIASTTGGSIGVGFAIPIDSVKTAINSVLKTGQIIRPYLGVRYQAVTNALQQLYSLPVNYGAYVTSGDAGGAAVVSGSPADKAGIKANDIILEVNGDRVDQNNSLSGLLGKHQPGDQVTLHVQRGKSTLDIKVTLDKMPTA
ncbi:MAG: trypsin-like peptidase domain-containing protein [bacterium]